MKNIAINIDFKWFCVTIHPLVWFVIPNTDRHFDYFQTGLDFTYYNFRWLCFSIGFKN